MQRRGGWLALGLVVGLGLAWGGFALVEAAPPATLTTCTKSSNNKTKVIAPSLTARCTRNGRGVVQSWVPASQLANANKYRAFLRGMLSGATTNFRGLDLSSISASAAFGVSFDVRNANFTNSSLQDSGFFWDARGANFTGVDFSGSNLFGNWAGANFTDTIFNGNPSVTLGGDFTGANFTNAYITDGPLWPANMTNANFQNANFTDANLQYADLTGSNVSGVIWNNTTCPNGNNSDAFPNCAGQGGGL
jgi:uncharacterized protein YjbI with pentapeptide repeats